MTEQAKIDDIQRKLDRCCEILAIYHANDWQAQNARRSHAKLLIELNAMKGVNRYPLTPPVY